MDVGLHIGIGAWIHAQGDARGFAVWPSMPVQLSLGDLEVATTMHDVVRAWEFAQLVNVEVREGQPLGGSASPLWVRHHQVLARMEFAARAWNAAEQSELEAAVAVLFEPGPFPTPTPAHLLYEEYAKAHRDLEQSQAAAADIAAVLALWVVAGKKVEIETARGTISRLMQRSTRPVAESQRSMLNPDLLLSTPTGSYAPTTATPLSASDESTWLRAQTTVEELDRSVGDSRARPRWEAWRANRHGAVRFRFVVLTLHRSWFTPELYERRDWRLPDSELASAGDGVGGAVPAFADRLYLAALEDTQLSGAPSGERPEQPAEPRPIRPAVIPHMSEVRPAMHLARMVTPRKEIGLGQLATVRAVTVRPAAAVTEALGSPIVVGPIVLTESTMHAVALGRLERVPLDRLRSRFALAEGLVLQQPTATPPASASPAFVVGLGCRAVPAAPNPNDTYQWAA